MKAAAIEKPSIFCQLLALGGVEHSVRVSGGIESGVDIAAGVGDDDMF